MTRGSAYGLKMSLMCHVTAGKNYKCGETIRRPYRGPEPLMVAVRPVSIRYIVDMTGATYPRLRTWAVSVSKVRIGCLSTNTCVRASPIRKFGRIGVWSYI